MRWTAAALLLIASTVVLDGCASGGPALERPSACDGSGFATPLLAARSPITEARAIWLDDHRLRWPGSHAGSRFRLVGSGSAALDVRSGAVVGGVDAAITLQPSTEPLDADLAQRFRWFGTGLELAVPTPKLNRPLLLNLLRGQLLLVEEDAAGKVLAATRVQQAGLLDSVYAGAAATAELGATPSTAGTRFALWAPTAQRCRSACSPMTTLPPTACCRSPATRRPASGAASTRAISGAAPTSTWSTSRSPASASCATG